MTTVEHLLHNVLILWKVSDNSCEIGGHNIYHHLIGCTNYISLTCPMSYMLFLVTVCIAAHIPKPKHHHYGASFDQRKPSSVWQCSITIFSSVVLKKS